MRGLYAPKSDGINQYRKEKRAQMIKQRDELSRNAKRARELGLSYGTYMSYVETGYISKYLEYLKKKPTEDGNIIESNIGGSSRVGKIRGGRMGMLSAEQKG